MLIFDEFTDKTKLASFCGSRCRSWYNLSPFQKQYWAFD